MELNDLLLKKEELLIMRDTSFFVPIHPVLLDGNIKLDPKIAQKVFPEAAYDWYRDLGEYVESLEEGQIKEWIETVFLAQKPEIITEFDSQRIRPIYWEDWTELNSNGFSRVFSIGRDNGGSLYFNQGEGRCKEFVSFESGHESIRFSKMKLKEFGESYSVGNLDGVILRVFAQHNIDYFPGALFLRNWTILYMNEALKQVMGKEE